jgi:tRNA(Ile)-lysidine synthase
VVEQGTHKPLVGGSNPPSATTPTPLDRLADAVDRGCAALAIPDDAALLLAVSGGADSMALLHGAATLVRSRTRRWRLAAAHLDHGLRPESAVDARFVAEAAAALGVPCEMGRADVAALARSEGRSLEEAGREARYRFLEAAAPSSTLIATGHTLDDSAETVLLNLLRGTGLAGVAGIPARRGRIVRPLLTERRARLRELLVAADLPFRDDPTNADQAFDRNRVRARLVPLLEELRPGAVERIGRFSRLAAEDDRLLDEMAAAELDRRRRSDGAIAWHDPPPRALGRRALRLACGVPAPAAERIEALLDAAEGQRGGVRIELGGGIVAVIRERCIRIE